MRIAIDTNVLGYAEGLDDPQRQERANDVLEALHGHSLVVPVQVGAELHRLVMRRRRVDAVQAKSIVARWFALIPDNPETTSTVFELALSLAGEHRLQIFDAIILAASAQAQCHLLLSEDLGDGFVWRGVTIANPFAANPHPLLADALRA